MNTREKFLTTLLFESRSEIPKWEYGYWAEAVLNWRQEGFSGTQQFPIGFTGGKSVRAEIMGYKPGGFVDLDIHQLFEMDKHQRRIPVNNFIYPRFEEKILEDLQDTIVVRDGWGITRRKKKDQSSLDHFVSGPVSSIEDWEKLKERLQPDTPGRFPDNWQELVTGYKQRDYPLILGGGHGFFGSVRYLMGEVESLMGFIESPELIHAINDHLCNLWIDLSDRVLKFIKPDMFLIWEDMCYKNGPLISPAMVEEFMVPYYKRLCGFLKDNGVEIIHVDTDGDAWKIIKPLLAGGMTGTFPLEVNANMDVIQLRESFPNLQLIGGVDKMALIKGKDAIDNELVNKILPVMKQGGFIPSIDHLVPPGVSWENFRYYREKLNHLIDSL